MPWWRGWDPPGCHQWIETIDFPVKSGAFRFQFCRTNQCIAARMSASLAFLDFYWGYCPQFDALIDVMTVESHLYLYGRMKGRWWNWCPPAAPFLLLSCHAREWWTIWTLMTLGLIDSAHFWYDYINTNICWNYTRTFACVPYSFHIAFLCISIFFHTVAYVHVTLWWLMRKALLAKTWKLQCFGLQKNTGFGSCFGKPSHNENIVFHVFQCFSAIHPWPGIQLEHRLQDLITPGCHRCLQFVTRSMRRSVRCSWRCTAHGGLARSQEEPSELGFCTNEKNSENLADLNISRRSKPIKTDCKTDRINCRPDKTKRRLSFSGKCTRRRNQQVAQLPHKE